MTNEALLTVIQRRLREISEVQHALARERAWLVAQTTPLRMFSKLPSVVLAEAEAQGIALH
ncbi:MAG: hypothetical protein DMD79_02015 [Candidatus Rokuibacteriota bacterium]|jgi:hypothetical protein|nr:MAG: hypothetical protein DMD79_02015 [Candidatus Rokubacteria bacterium]